MIKEQNWYEATQLDELLKQHSEYENYRLLLEIQSLTQGLEQINPNFSVDLLFLGELPETLGNPLLFSRQVQLKLEDLPVIWAESICDAESDFWCEYLNCGTQSLGRKLFTGKAEIERSEFTYKVFSKEQLPFSMVMQYDLEGINHIISRRSFFMHHQERLCLTEWYLPNIRKFIVR